LFAKDHRKSLLNKNKKNFAGSDLDLTRELIEVLKSF
jgi:hypothetical protein